MKYVNDRYQITVESFNLLSQALALVAPESYAILHVFISVSRLCICVFFMCFDMFACVCVCGFTCVRVPLSH